MKRRVALAGMVLLIAVVVGAFFAGRSYAQSEDKVGEVPIGWGSVKAGTGTELVFETPDGTIRIAEVRRSISNGKATVKVEVKYMLTRVARVSR